MLLQEDVAAYQQIRHRTRDRRMRFLEGVDELLHLFGCRWHDG